MKNSSILIAALAFAGAPLHAQAPDELADKVLAFFKARCVACHGTNATEPKEFQFIDNLAELAKSDFVDLKVPENSRLYTVLRDSEMPILTKAEKQEGKKRVDDVTAEEVALVKAWIVAGAPSGGGAPAASAPQKPVATTPPPTPAATQKPGPAVEAAPKRAARRVISHQELIAAALADLNSLPREEQSGTRYISIAALHNNSAELSEGQLEIMRSGVRKMMNSLSTNPNIAKFEEVGPEKVLFRIRLRDVNWSPKLWDRVASFFPQSVDAGLGSALTAATGAKVAILPAEWLAATATRPPLYHEILDLPQKLVDLEKRLGVNAAANIAAGEVIRAGFTESGVSAHNRLIERHSLNAWSGYYWVSYDFKESGGKSSLLANPLGPESMKLLGGAHAFKHAGGEFIFSLPNGMQAYYVADVLGSRLDGAVPTDIVGDKTNVTGRVEISNGLSCIICHDNGMKEPKQADQVRAIAGGFGTEEKQLIERLHPPQEKVEAVLKEDAGKFLAALSAAGVKQSDGREPVGELAKRFEKPVTLAKAAAELGVSEEDFNKRVDPRKDPNFFNTAILLGSGTLAREHFLDLFPDLIARLDIGKVRKAEPLAEVKLPGREDVKKLRPIAVQITTDKTRYRGGDEKDKKGDLLYATVTAAEAGHLRLLYQNAKGEIITLFPNQFQKDDRIPGGVPVKVPSDTAGFDIEIVGPPFGQEHLIAIVTDRPFTDEAALKEELAKTEFAEATTRDLEVAVAKSARVIARDERGRRVGRTGFSRITIESHE